MSVYPATLDIPHRPHDALLPSRLVALLRCDWIPFHVLLVAGLAYLVGTLTCSLWYCTLLAPSMTNDLYWPHYNTTGYQVILIDLLNVQLQTIAHGAVDLLAADMALPKSYADISTAATLFQSNYARRVLYSDMTSLPHAIVGMRNTEPHLISSAYGQYCWVDLAKRWDIAHSDARARRCLERYADNAANYLEFVARNVDWAAFLEVYHNSWDIVIGLAVASSAEGRQWLADRPAYAIQLPVDDEVSFLQTYNVTRYQLQWQNDVQMGHTESVVLCNVLDVEYMLPLKAMDHVWGPWTSVNMYWNFRNDLITLADFNLSLVRDATNDFRTAMGFDYSKLMGLADANGNFIQQIGAFFNAVGPFGCVDLLFVELPPTLASFYTAFSNAMRLSSPSSLAAFETLPSFSLTPWPHVFGDPGLTFFGGNLLCLFNRATPFPQSQFAFDDLCVETLPFTIEATAKSIVFALLASGATTIESVCAMQVSPDCVETLRQVYLWTRMDPLSNVAALQTLRFQAAREVPPIQFTQYGQTNDSEWVLLEQPLLTSDPNWAFYGWLTLFDWAEGRREVVAIDGDVSTVVVMSEPFPLLTVPVNASSQSVSGPQMLAFLVFYVVVVSLLVGLLLVVYAVCTYPRIDGRHLFVFNRVALMVWVGRPLLFVRGLTAVLLLGSAQTQLVATATGYSKFVATPRAVWTTCLLASEATWIVYTVSDALTPWTGRRTRLVAPMASLTAWLVTVVLESTTPVVLSATLDRVCTTKNVQEYLFCHSGFVTVGSWRRVMTLALVDGIALVAGWLLGACATRWPAQTLPEAPWRLHGSAAVLLQEPTMNLCESFELDEVASAMTGLIAFQRRGITYVFDIKLWLVHRQTNQLPRHMLSTKDEHVSTEVAAVTSKWVSRLAVLGGFAYVLASCVGSVSYIAVSTVNFANDFYWATFNLTGHHIALANWYHQQLGLGRSTLSRLRLDDPKWSTIDVNYSDSTLQIALSSPWYGASLQFEILSDMRMSIQGLRRSDGCQAPWIFSQYCWVDFDRRWPMAVTAARQDRCQAGTSNGALYLEAVLRNTDWDAFHRCWAPAFDVAFGNELRSSVDGLAWLAQTRTNQDSIDAEVATWTRAGLSHYTVQWQTFKFPGLVNTYAIENAFGVGYPLTLSHSNGSYAIAAQTSFKMYWGLANDLWAVTANSTTVIGHSLIRTSATFAFRNASMVSVMAQTLTLSLPLNEAFALVQDLIGPFGSIDEKHVPCPEAVRPFLALGIDLIRTTNAQSVLAGDTYVDIAPLFLSTHFAIPSKALQLSTWKTFGGSILCQDFGGSLLAQGFLQLTSRQFPCGQSIYFLSEPSKDNVLVAVLATGLEPMAVPLVCAHDTAPSKCLDGFLGPSVAYVHSFVPPQVIGSMAAMAASAAVDIIALQPALMQYASETSTQPLHMLLFPLLDPTDPTFDFWSWLYVLEWATGAREVVSFEGDVGSVHLVTEWTPPTHQHIVATELPTTITTLALAGVQYVTAVMLGISTLALVYVGASGGNVEPRNLFKHNRVGAIVWVGRPLLVLRGVTALCLLSTATLELTYAQDTRRSGFEVPALPWYKTILGAGEAAWLVYICNDVAMVCIEARYTTVYTTVASSLVWLTVAVLTLLRPVDHEATIDLQCRIDEMDLQLCCGSGIVTIGHVTRLYELMGIIGLANVLGYVVARAYVKAAAIDDDDDTHPFPLISAGALHLFHRSKWMHAKNIYCIDPASALLNGMVSLRLGSTIHVLDIKVWRHMTFEALDHIDRRLKATIPLGRYE
ncbi:Aste57867_24780 [Aphanomyces stellatus]|uniref:Aste57867_24780 protein n=1 Tax=Aphanomyces stellatus TaxID=120398 RepID=A0A485LRB9_9STRA|nr:hypothetical protein As57867_024702 [Aphanomyces stellatus]VFU01415.1 Aste57867_24780 [Aphanomyces stellatus]